MKIYSIIFLLISCALTTYLAIVEITVVTTQIQVSKSTVSSGLLHAFTELQMDTLM